MAEYSEEDLFDMSDEQLEQAFKEAKAQESSPDTEIEEQEEEVIEDEAADTEEEFDETVEETDSDEVDDEDTEQPDDDEDSDDNSDEDEEEDDSEEDSEDKESDEEPTEEEDADKSKEQEVQKYKFKANGQEFEFTEKEIREQFPKVFGQAMDYTKKMQKIKPYRGMIASIEEQNLTQDDLNLAIDVLKGDKDAMAAVLKRTGVDALDLETDSERNYQPNNYGRNETELAIQDVVSEISNDAEYTMTHHVIDKQWDDKSRETFVSNPQLIKELHTDVKNGVYDKVSPIATKLKVVDGGRKSDIEYYVEAGQKYYADLQAENSKTNEEAKLAAERQKLEQERTKLEEAKKQTAKRKATVNASKKRKAAAPTKSRVKKDSAIDYLDDSDEAFEEWYKKLQDEM